MAGSTDGQAGNLHDAGGWAIGPTSRNCKKKMQKTTTYLPVLVETEDLTSPPLRAFSESFQMVPLFLFFLGNMLEKIRASLSD